MVLKTLQFSFQMEINKLRRENVLRRTVPNPPSPTNADTSLSFCIRRRGCEAVCAFARRSSVLTGISHLSVWRCPHDSRWLLCLLLIYFFSLSSLQKPCCLPSPLVSDKKLDPPQQVRCHFLEIKTLCCNLFCFNTSNCGILVSNQKGTV